MNLNYNIKKIILEDIRREEENSFKYNKENLISIRELLQIYKDRYALQKKYINKKITLFENNIINDISFHEDESDNDDILLLVDLNDEFVSAGFNKPILLYKNGYLSFWNEECFSVRMATKIKEVLFKEYIDVFKKIGDFGIFNGFNKEITTNTISQKYKVSLNNYDLYLSLNDNLLKFKRNRLILGYNYDEQYDKYDYIINTIEGNFHLTTNIWGIKKVLNPSLKKEQFNDKELQPIIRLINNLKVDTNSLPKFLNQEITKSKKLILKK